MKAVFTHDNIFIKDDKNNYYSSGKLPYEVFQRYLKYFEEITVIGREITNNNPEDLKKLNLSSGEGVKFKCVPSLSNPISMVTKRKVAVDTIEEALKESDVLIARLPSITGNLSVKIAKKLNKPYFIEMVACCWDSLWNYGNIQGKLFAPYLYNDSKKILKDATHVVYVTSQFLQSRYPTNGKQLACSDVEIGVLSNSVLQERKDYIQSNKSTVYTIGLIGSLNSKYKGIEVAFKALKKLLDNGINVNFKILGDGDATKWKALANELKVNKLVEFSGTLPQGKAVFEWLKTLDLYIQPSFQEGLPRSLVEAMSQAVPCIGSSAGGIPELINLDFLHTPGDHTKLSNDLSRILKDKNLQISLAEKSFDTAKNYQKEILKIKRDKFFDEFMINLT